MRRERPEDAKTVDVAIAGAGPAGRWLASLLVERNLRVAIVDPSFDDEWPNTYGVWRDAVEGLVDDDAFERTWSHVVVRAETRRVLDRAYGLIDNEALCRSLDRRLEASGVDRIEGYAEGVDHGPQRSILDCGETTLEARVVVDASGGTAGLTGVGCVDDCPFQRAYGLEATFDGDPLDGDGMVLMDHRPVAGESTRWPPSFLYGMHLGGGRYFVEETVLVTSQNMPWEVLEIRLHRRLDMRGARVVGDDRQVEYCHIPMGTPLASREEPTLGFGASAGLVHPATGYQIGRMLRAGPPVADAVADGIECGEPNRRIAQRARQRLWPRGLRRARRLLMVGRDVLSGLDRARLRTFFESFFAHTDRHWRDYLRGDAGYRDVARAMWQLFRRADPGLRWLVGRRALGARRQLIDALRAR